MELNGDENCREVDSVSTTTVRDLNRTEADQSKLDTAYYGGEPTSDRAGLRLRVEKGAIGRIEFGSFTWGLNVKHATKRLRMD